MVRQKGFIAAAAYGWIAAAVIAAVSGGVGYVWSAASRIEVKDLEKQLTKNEADCARDKGKLEREHTNERIAITDAAWKAATKSREEVDKLLLERLQAEHERLQAEQAAAEALAKERQWAERRVRAIKLELDRSSDVCVRSARVGQLLNEQAGAGADGRAGAPSMPAKDTPTTAPVGSDATPGRLEPSP